ncbi:MAG: FAD-binding oxidoreductase [Anaerolineales bacterium]
MTIQSQPAMLQLLITQACTCDFQSQPFKGRSVTLPAKQVELTNWSKSAHSACFVYPAEDVGDIRAALAAARAQDLSVIPHGAGHSYTDAALNTAGIVIDVTSMRRIQSWDPAQGIMQVEPGVTLQAMVETAWPDGWWPANSPSTARVTLAGCAAMNINGRNAWKTGPFGANILSLDVILSTGEVRTFTPERDPLLFHAFVGSMGLLGIITSVTVQLQRAGSGYVAVRQHSAAGLDEIFDLFTQEKSGSDFMEAWLDGFARGDQLGRGHVTCAVLSPSGPHNDSPFRTFANHGRLEESAVSLAARLARPALVPAVQMANRGNYWWARQARRKNGQLRGLIPYTYWPWAFFTGYHALLPHGIETFQAFVPEPAAPVIFKQILLYSQQHDCMPLWCVIKKHRRDPFLLSYQVDGFSLELNYARAGRNAQTLQPVLEHMIAMVIDAGGRFYLAKDHFLTSAQYRQSVGEQAVETFLQLKQQLDPEMRLQSDLFRRLFLPGPG